MERVTITIDDDLLRSIDATVDGRTVKSRSHAIDVLLNQALSRSIVTAGVVLAAGKKERLWSPEHDALKPLVEVDGKPVIEHVLLKLREAGVKRVVIVVGYGGEQLVAKLKDGADYGLHIDYVWDENSTGSAGALLLCKDKLPETFILSYSDVYYPELDLVDLVKFHVETAKRPSCTLALVNVKSPAAFGVAKLTGSKIVSFTEKPRSEVQSNLVNAGIAVCEPSIFSHIAKVPSSFEKELLPALAEKEKLYGYIYSGKWMDVGMEE